MKAIRIARYILVIITVFAASIYLPKFYWLSFDTRTSTPYVLYSPTMERFVIRGIEEGERQHYDDRGNILTRDEFEAATPFVHFRQLMVTDLLPDSIRGVELDLPQIRVNNFTLFLNPSHFNTPQIDVYPMFESASGRMNLEMPDEFFRIRQRMEFISTSRNKIDENLSALFTDAMIAEDFQFPARGIFGNATTRKPFDEGYFVLDASENLFHVKMIEGEPYCRNTNIPESISVKAIFVNELHLREFYGMLVTEENEVYLITTDEYEPVKLPVEGYDPDSMRLLVRGDLFYRTITIIKEDGIDVAVVDREYNSVDRYSDAWETRYETRAGIVSNIVFPFTISLTKRQNYYVNFYTHMSNALSLIGIFISLGIAVGILKYRKKQLKRSWFTIAIVLVTGLYGLIATTVIDEIT